MAENDGLDSDDENVDRTSGFFKKSDSLLQSVHTCVRPSYTFSLSRNQSKISFYTNYRTSILSFLLYNLKQGATLANSHAAKCATMRECSFYLTLIKNF